MKKLILRSYLLVAGVFSAQAMAADFTIRDYSLVSKKRVNRNETDFVYKVSVTNNGPAAANVSASVASRSRHIRVLESDLAFGPVPARDTVVSRDTITLRHNTRHAFDKSRLIWTVAAVPDSGAAPKKLAIAVNGKVSVVNVNGTDTGGTRRHREISAIPDPRQQLRYTQRNSAGTAIDPAAVAAGNIHGYQLDPANSRLYIAYTNVVNYAQEARHVVERQQCDGYGCWSSPGYTTYVDGFTYENLVRIINTGSGQKIADISLGRTDNMLDLSFKGMDKAHDRLYISVGNNIAVVDTGELKTDYATRFTEIARIPDPRTPLNYLQKGSSGETVNASAVEQGAIHGYQLDTANSRFYIAYSNAVSYSQDSQPVPARQQCDGYSCWTVPGYTIYSDRFSYDNLVRVMDTATTQHLTDINLGQTDSIPKIEIIGME